MSGSGSGIGTCWVLIKICKIILFEKLVACPDNISLNVTQSKVTLIIHRDLQASKANRPHEVKAFHYYFVDWRGHHMEKSVLNKAALNQAPDKKTGQH